MDQLLKIVGKTAPMNRRRACPGAQIIAVLGNLYQDPCDESSRTMIKTWVRAPSPWLWYGHIPHNSTLLPMQEIPIRLRWPYPSYRVESPLTIAWPWHFFPSLRFSRRPYNIWRDVSTHDVDKFWMIQRSQPLIMNKGSQPPIMINECFSNAASGTPLSSPRWRLNCAMVNLDHAGIAFFMVLMAGLASCLGASAVYFRTCVPWRGRWRLRSAVRRASPKKSWGFFRDFQG